MKNGLRFDEAEFWWSWIHPSLEMAFARPHRCSSLVEMEGEAGMNAIGHAESRAHSLRHREKWIRSQSGHFQTVSIPSVSM